MATRFRLNFEQIFGTSAQVLAGGSLTFCISGGSPTQLRTIWQDVGLSVTKLNPVVLDSAGKHGDIWLDDPSLYRVILKDAAGIVLPGGDVDPVDGVQTGPGVSIERFGASPSQTPSYNAGAINDALATGLDVIVPPAIYPVGGELDMTTPYQTLFGSGELSQLQFSLPALGIGVNISAGERQRIRNIYLNGMANVAKLVAVSARQVTIQNARLANATAGGHGVYVENETSGLRRSTQTPRVPAVFSFGLIVDKCIISGSYTTGALGVRFGLNSQTARITNNVLENWGTHVAVQDATDNIVIAENVLERSVDRAVDLDKPGGNPFMGVITIEGNHFEENQVCVRADGGEFHNLSIRKNFAYRNTAAKLNSFFYMADVGASAASDDIAVEENYIEDFDVAFGLAGEYPARLRGTHGNTLVNVNSYSSGPFADAAYDIRTINPYYTRKLVSGAFLSEGHDRLEAKSAVFEQPVLVSSHDYLAKITFLYVQTGGTGVTVELRKITSTASIATDTLVATVTANTDGVLSLPLGAYGDASVNYYLKATYNNTGTSGFVYPFRLFMR